MENISLKEYLKYSIDKQDVLKLEWVVSMFSILMEDSSYIKLGLKKEFVVKVDGVEYTLENIKQGQPIINPTDIIEVDKGYMVNITENTKTTVGKILLNYVLLVYNFKHKVPYQNTTFTVSDIENKYIVKLLKDKEDIKQGEDIYITIEEYLSFIDSAVYLENWADVVSTSSTEKSILPPPGIEEYRKKVINEAIKEHGEDALNDYSVIVEIENKLKAYDREFLKDDPSYGKLLDGKMLNNSRKKLYLMTGAAKNFKEHNSAELLDKPLADGWDDDPVKLTEQFNSIRHGSYSRGKETFKGGLTAKILLRATSSMLIEKNDCKTPGYKNWVINKNNAKALIGRYIMIGSSPVLLEDESVVNKYINTEVKLRSPMYCLPKNSENICPICAGLGLSDNENSIPLLITSIGEVMLKSSLKKVHNNNVSTVKLDLNEAIT